MRDWDENLMATMDLLLSGRGREPSRMLSYLFGVLAILAVHTGLLTLGWPAAANWAMAGLLLLGTWLAWREHRRATPPTRDVPKHQGWSDDPDELEAQLAAIRRPVPPIGGPE